jgi:hypothetical protein
MIDSFIAYIIFEKGIRKKIKLNPILRNESFEIREIFLIKTFSKIAKIKGKLKAIKRINIGDIFLLKFSLNNKKLGNKIPMTNLNIEFCINFLTILNKV